jgi:hypothetical protein
VCVASIEWLPRLTERDYAVSWYAIWYRIVGYRYMILPEQDNVVLTR